MNDASVDLASSDAPAPDHSGLLADLTPLLKRLTDDLRERLDKPGAEHDWAREQWERTKKAGRSAATWTAYRDDLATQAAVAWVLGSVFVRWCEDNGLITPHLSGPGERTAQAQDAQLAHVRQEAHRMDTDADWIKVGFAAVAASDAGRLLFDPEHNPAYRVTLSHLAAQDLIAFWRETDEAGALKHDFTDPTWNTRFLGDLYQDLSEATRDKYALLQTPEFVEEFILDYTLEPAVREFGLDGLRVIDPTCGSGHFLLGTFHRLVDKWRYRAPGLDDSQLARKALDSVHGVDINPFAVAIARFRLMLAAWKVAGVESIAQAKSHSWRMAVAVWDSLLEPAVQEDLFNQGDERENDWEDITDFSREELLKPGSYHAVVGNPPYINVSDPELNKTYRGIYKTAYKQYQLTVPFAERFFLLAKLAGEDRWGAGYVGQITSNAFMKREFGKKLVQEYLPSVNLTHVIDTSGAHIPGHGTPTVVLFGRRAWPTKGSFIRTVLGIQGEPDVPDDSANGAVWKSIINQVENPGSESEWVTVVDTPRGRLAKHPWSLSGGGAEELTLLLESNSSSYLNEKAEIGTGAVTREDLVFIVNARVLRRNGVNSSLIQPLAAGEDVRDWELSGVSGALWPYKKDTLEAIADQATIVWTWPYRLQLSQRTAFGKTQIEHGKKWFEYSMFFKRHYSNPLSVAFAHVATHNHFSFDQSGMIFNRTAPVVKFPADSKKEDCLEVVGVLNSSAACFRLRQTCFPKGGSGIGRGVQSEAWMERLDINASNVEKIPLPATLPLDRSRRIDDLAQQLSAVSPASIAEETAPTRERLDAAHAEYARLRGRMIAEQEELDWDVYRRYDLLDDEEFAAVVIDDPSTVPELNLGERAFEIMLARKMAAGEVDTQWFARHGSTPITELPAHWPGDYRRVVQARIDLIEKRRDLALVERPECKRRWNTETWQSQEQRALREWLLDRLEDENLWYAEDANGYVQPTPRSVAELTDLLRDDATFRSVAALWATHAFGDADTRPREILAALVDTEHVPFLDAHRYKRSGLDKRAEWEHVWDKQRTEDDIAAELGKDIVHPEVRAKVEAEIGTIEVPPKYAKGDFLRDSYWRNRGKLDVPKERFVSYPGASRDNDGSLLLGWAGWDHREQAQALAVLTAERGSHDGWEADHLAPLLAGLRQLLPWVAQWHPDVDPDHGQPPHETYRAFLDDQLGILGLTETDLAEWRPAGRVDVSPLPRKPKKAT